MEYRSFQHSTAVSRKHSGFTLLELAIVLAIIGTILTGGLVMLTGSLEATRVNATVLRMDKIHKTLLDYAIAYGQLPCPADLTLATTDANFGAQAASNNSTCYGATPSANVASSGGAVEGAVPTRTLRLPDEYMYDAWGRKFRYAVNPARTAASSFPPASGTQCVSAGDLTVNDASGAARTTKAAYVLVSHGANGHGGYTKNAAIFSAGSTNTDEQTNCHCGASGAYSGTYNATYVAKLPTESSSSLTDMFDDIVTFRETWQMQTPSIAMATSSTCNPDIFMLTDTAPYLYLYTYNNGTFTPLTSPSVSNGTFLNLSVSADGAYVAVMDGDIKIYQSSGGSLSLLQNITASGYGWNAVFSPDATYLAVVQNYSPTLRIFKKSGSTYSELPTALDVNHDNVDSVAWSPDGTYLALLTDVASQYLYIYKRTGDSFATLSSIPATSTHSSLWHDINEVDFSSDGNYLAVATDSHFMHVYNRSGDSFTLASSTATACNAGEVYWSNSGDYVSYEDHCGTTMYNWNGTTLTSLFSGGDYWAGFGPSDAYAYGWNASAVFAACTLASDKTSCSPTYTPSPQPSGTAIKIRARKH